MKTLQRAINRLLNGRTEHPLHWLTSDIAVAPAPRPEAWRSVVTAGVRSVVDLREERDDTEAAGKQGLTYLRLPVREGYAPNEAEMMLLTNWIAERIERDGPVLVCCREGRGRSALVACATLLHLGLPLAEAYQLLRRRRPEASLNDLQIGALERFAKVRDSR